MVKAGRRAKARDDPEVRGTARDVLLLLADRMAGPGVPDTEEARRVKQLLAVRRCRLIDIRLTLGWCFADE